MNTGDVVRLKSDVRWMTVKFITPDTAMVVCSWLDVNGQPQEAVYYEDQLYKVGGLK